MALVSACVWRERGEQRPRVREDMQGPYRSLLEAARRIGKVGAALHAHAARSVLVGSGVRDCDLGLSAASGHRTCRPGALPVIA